MVRALVLLRKSIAKYRVLYPGQRHLIASFWP
jgi:hypothetical protein